MTTDSPETREQVALEQAAFIRDYGLKLCICSPVGNLHEPHCLGVRHINAAETLESLAALTPTPAPNDSGLVERIGNAIERAWNSDCAEAEGLPPISLIESERDYLARAVLTQLSAAPSSEEVERYRSALEGLLHDMHEATAGGMAWIDHSEVQIFKERARQALSPPSQEEQS